MRNLVMETTRHYAYFPGCTLKNKALDLDLYARKSAEVLGFTLDEIPEWQCCGGEYPLAKNEIATKLSSVRALADAQKAGKDLVTLCSACYNVIKQVNNDMRTDENVILKEKLDVVLPSDELRHFQHVVVGDEGLAVYLLVLVDDVVELVLQEEGRL